MIKNYWHNVCHEMPVMKLTLAAIIFYLFKCGIDFGFLWIHRIFYWSTGQ